MSDREWRTSPPAQGRGRYDWHAITAELREHPGEWTLIDPEASRSMVGAVKSQRMTALRSDTWEYLAKSRNNTQRTAELWMSAVRREQASGE